MVERELLITTNTYSNVNIFESNMKEIYKCAKCGEVFEEDLPVSELRVKYTPGRGYTHYLTKPGFVERRMAIGKANNDRLWEEVYEKYDGISDLHDFVDWLKEYYIVPEKI